MGTTCDSITSADIGECNLIDLKYNCVRIAHSERVAVQSDAGDFIDNTVGQSNRWCLPAVADASSTSVRRWRNCLRVKINNRRIIAWRILENRE